MTQHAAGVSLSTSGNSVLIVERSGPAGVYHDNFCDSIDNRISIAEYNVILFVAAPKLPRRFEELKEFANNLMVRGIGDYSYHHETLMLPQPPAQCVSATIAEGRQD